MNFSDDDYRKVDDIKDTILYDHDAASMPEEPWYVRKGYTRCHLAASFLRAAAFICTCVFAGLQLKVEKNLNSATIHTQTLNDWTARSWVDFSWASDGKCLDGYEPIGVTWRGSKPYNITSYGVSV